MKIPVFIWWFSMALVWNKLFLRGNTILEKAGSTQVFLFAVYQLNNAVGMSSWHSCESVCKASIHILFHHFRQQDMKKQRISLAIGIVASIIFLLCVALVTISLHLTPQMDQFASKSQDNVLSYCIDFSFLGFSN